jgi:ubiquinone/menaquinone biosynthesis C-methylase UbiE
MVRHESILSEIPTVFLKSRPKGGIHILGMNDWVRLCIGEPQACRQLYRSLASLRDFRKKTLWDFRNKLSGCKKMNTHNSRILDQFTRQAEPFAQAQAIRNQEALDRIVKLAEAGSEDTSLDVACGPGLLACAFARVVRHAVGLDLTPAMLEQARKTQAEQGLANVTWQQGDVNALPFPDAHFSIVSSRFAFHHLLDPLAALKEMNRACKPGGRVVVVDMAPAADKADELNAEERLRDPSHVRAMPAEELRELFAQAGLPQPRMERYRLEGELEDLLRRSFPNEGDADRVRKIFDESITGNALDLNVRREKGKIFFAFPVAIMVATKSE